VGQTAEKAALLKGCNQAVDARLGRQVQRLLHFVEGRRNARFLDPVIDEQEQFALFLGEHLSTCLNR
jgi:hypothetical protein